MAVVLALVVLPIVGLVGRASADNTYEACFRSKVNAERRSRGVHVLRDNAEIDAVARRHSDRMAADRTIYHNDNLANEIPPYEYAGENVGEGPDCDSVHQAFMASPGHRENVLDPDYTDLGVGVTVRDETVYVTEDFFTPKERSRSAPTVKPDPCRG